MALALIDPPTWGTVASHQFTGIDQKAVANALPMFQMVMSVTDQVESTALRNAPRGLRIVYQGNLASSEFEFGIRAMQSYLRKAGGHLLLQSSVTVVVALYDVDWSVKSLRHLSQNEWCNQVAAVQQCFTSLPAHIDERLLQIPDIVMAIRKDRDSHTVSPFRRPTLDPPLNILIVYPTAFQSAME